ncbi:MAG: HEAT repeat domain-containing protein [Dehalococcoidia bacterium]
MPQATAREIEALVDHLASGTRLTVAQIALLSDLSPDEAKPLSAGWQRIPADAKEALLDEAIVLAEGDVGLNFRRLAEIGLEDPESTVRISAIAGLWESRERDTARRLVLMLGTDPEEAVRAAAAGSLREFVLARELGQFDTEVGDDVVEALRTAFEDRTEALNVRAAAIEALGSRSLPWVATAISDAYYDDDRTLRISALRAMGDSADTRWFELLEDDLESSEPDVRFEAAAAVGEIGNEGGAVLLAPLLEDVDQTVLVAAIRALGAIGGDASIELLEEFLAAREDDDGDEAELKHEAERAIERARSGDEEDIASWDG